MKETRLPRGFGLLRDPLFLGPRMRDIYTNFKNHTFFGKNVFCRKKNKTRLPRGRRPLRDPLLLAPIMRDTIRNSFEGGGVALPDYSSREGCRVEVQESCEEGSRVFF